ncbi:DUF892 family protein [Mucilaginibacter limnophilus]|uniref:DUF892 family protein n=1 Tax=Mucilaginibacter limnophilus TaxID=1932778 RepID=A0A437MUN0_9SPHI|nr:DUF892 family protein [Mucilaginibacter limnophilus]RVU01362.1 DUF892 family protein [Mucilaginibacter limnophilus]
MAPHQKPDMRIFRGHFSLDEISLRKIFMVQLNSIFCVKQHLLKYLPTLIERASFNDLKNAIIENIDDIKIQLLRMEAMYQLLHETYSPHKCLGIKSITLEAFITNRDLHLSDLENDLTMLIHLRTLENIEITCFEVMHDIAAALPNKELDMMLKQNLDMAKDSQRLYKLITKEYLH